MAKYKGWVAFALWEGNGGHFQNCLHFPRAGPNVMCHERDIVTALQCNTMCNILLLARDKIEIKPGAVRGMCCHLSLVKLRSKSRSGEGQFKVRKDES